jgi:hypothetical protein
MRRKKESERSKEKLTDIWKKEIGREEKRREEKVKEKGSKR